MSDKLNKNFWINFEEKGTTIEIDKPDYDEIVDNHFVKNLRAELDLTQKVFGDVLGVTKKTIEKWEQGVNPVKGTSARLVFLINNNHSLVNELYQVNIIKNYTITEGDAFTMKQITSLVSEKSNAFYKISPVEDKYEKQFETNNYAIEGGIPCQENLKYQPLYS